MNSVSQVALWSIAALSFPTPKIHLYRRTLYACSVSLKRGNWKAIFLMNIMCHSHSPLSTVAAAVNCNFLSALPPLLSFLIEVAVTLLRAPLAAEIKKSWGFYGLSSLI